MKKIIHAEDVPLPDPLTQEKEALEVRIREIVREELAAWEKLQVQKVRFGLPVNAETK